MWQIIRRNDKRKNDANKKRKKRKGKNGIYRMQHNTINARKEYLGKIGMVHELFVYQNSKSKECSSIMCNL